MNMQEIRECCRLITRNADSSKLPSLRISQGNRILKKGKFLLWVGDNEYIACETKERVA